MKIVIQNGAGNPISRKKMQCLVEIIPTSLFKGCSTFVLCESRGGESEITYYPKEQTIEFGAPSSLPLQSIAEELILGLELIQEKGMVPPKISVHRRSEILFFNQELISKCVGVLQCVSRLTKPTTIARAKNVRARPR